MEEIIFLETPTLGIRRTAVSRTVLARERVTVYTPYGPVAVKRAFLPDGTVRDKPEYEDCANTPYGPVAVKRAFLPDGTVRDKPEYEDCAKLARMHGIPLQVVARAAWWAAWLVWGAGRHARVRAIEKWEAIMGEWVETGASSLAGITRNTATLADAREEVQALVETVWRLLGPRADAREHREEHDRGGVRGPRLHRGA